MYDEETGEYQKFYVADDDDDDDTGDYDGEAEAVIEIEEDGHLEEEEEVGGQHVNGLEQVR